MIKDYCGTLYGNYRQRTFAENYEDITTFMADYKSIGIPPTISDQTATTLYYLLYSRYGNSTVASSDTTRFKYQLFSTIWQYGPAWEKRLEIQEKLRGLSENEILAGSKQIYNHAQNPSTDPDIDTDMELQYINDQNVTKNKKGKLEGYALLWQILVSDVTEQFLTKFNKLFLTVVQPELPLWYVTETENDN